MALRARRRETDPETSVRPVHRRRRTFQSIGDQGPGALVPRRPYRRHQQIPGHPVFRPPLSPPRDRAWGATPRLMEGADGDLRSKKDPPSRGLGMLAETMSWLQEGESCDRTNCRGRAQAVGRRTRRGARRRGEGPRRVADDVLPGTDRPICPPTRPRSSYGRANSMGSGMRQHDDVAKEMPIVPARLRASAAQQFVEVTPQIDPADGTIPAGVATVGAAPPLARHGQTQAPPGRPRRRRLRPEAHVGDRTGHGGQALSCPRREHCLAVGRHPRTSTR